MQDSEKDTSKEKMGGLKFMEEDIFFSLNGYDDCDTNCTNCLY